MTGSHPENHTPGSLDALAEYTEQGGRLMYLGGNGFYWRVRGQPGTARRGRDPPRRDRNPRLGGRAGEYYNAFDGGYGGLWRNSGRAPQRLAGVGIRRSGRLSRHRLPAASRVPRPRAAWIFEGIGDDELLGDSA